MSKMISRENLKVTSVAVVPDHWAQLQELAASQGSTVAGLVRRLIALELRRARKTGEFES